MFHTIVVPVDGSEFSARAVPWAMALANASHAAVRFVAVARTEGELAWMHECSHETIRRLGSGDREIDMIVDDDPARGLLEIATDPSNVLCFASHNHSRLATTVLHSVGSRLIERAVHPFLVVGPGADASRLSRDVVVAVDGVSDPAELLSIAAAWAITLSAPLRVVTVYEPVPADIRRPAHFSRHHGPPCDPDAYLETLTSRLSGLPDLPRPATAIAIPDPVSVVGGLSNHLEDHPALLLVAGSGRHGDWHVRGGVVSDLLRIVPLPVLVAKQEV